MNSGIFSTLFYKPLYNGLIYTVSVIPGANVGVAIVFLTILVRAILLPFSHRSVVSQAKMRNIAPELEGIKEKYKEDKQEQAKKTMELYKAHGINPFSGCIVVLVQLPVLFALYFVFSRGLSTLNTDALYSFVHMPSVVSMNFLGIMLSGKSILLAVVAALSQYFQIKLSVPPTPPAAEGKEHSFKDDFARSFNAQMRFMLPLIVFGVSYTMPAAIALYWTTSNLFSIAHELYVKRKSTATVA